MELLSAIISGGISGVVFAFPLVKLILNHKLEKSQLRFQHDLDQEKLERRSQLEVLVSAQKIRPVNYEQKNIEALEAAYASVARTSLSRQKFRKKPTAQKYTGSPEEQNTSKYFVLFSVNFEAFKNSFDAITNAFEIIDEKAVYLDPDIESNVNKTLSETYNFYHRRHLILQDEHKVAQRYFNGTIIPNEHMTFDFEEFYNSMFDEWRTVTRKVREDLKTRIRELLNVDHSTNL